MTADCVGGVWTYAMTLCRALRERRVDVTLAVTGGEISQEQRAEAEAVADLRHKPFKCEWMQPPLADVAAAGEWLEQLAAETSPDVIHLNDFAHGSRGFGGVRKVVVAHSDVVSWFAHVRHAEPDATWDAYRHAVATGLAGADAVVALTGHGADDLACRYAYAGRLEVIANAVEPDEFISSGREPFILAAGRLWDEAKGLAALADAASGCKWPVMLAGDAGHPDGGTASYRNVELLGPLPHDELRKLMRRAGLFVAVPHYEPFGLSIAEAAAADCPLLLSDIPTLRELWDGAASFVELRGQPPAPSQRLGEAINALIDDDEARRRGSEAAVRRASVFSPERQAEAYLALYHDLMNRNPPVRPTADIAAAAAPA